MIKSVTPFVVKVKVYEHPPKGAVLRGADASKIMMGGKLMSKST